MLTSALKSGRRLTTLLVLVVLSTGIVFSPPLFAQEDLTDDQKNAFSKNILYYDTDQVCASGGSASTLRGDGNEAQAFNFLIDKGLTNEQAAGVVGNFKAESGVNPKRVQGTQTPSGDSEIPTTGSIGGGNAWGLAQWDPGERIVPLMDQLPPEFLSRQPAPKIYDLHTQLEIVWLQLQTVSPTGRRNILPGLQAIKGNPREPQPTIEEAVRYFEENFEGAGVKNYPARYRFAMDVFNGISGSAPNNSTTTGTQCGTTNVGSVVQIAQQELAAGIKEQNDGHLKYGGNAGDAWCAWFVSWVFKQAGKPFTGGMGDGGYAYPAVSGMKAYAEEKGWYHPKSEADFVPQPGDVVIYDEGTGSFPSHVNIVISYDANTKNMQTIGGNEGNSSQDGGRVMQNTVNTSNSSITGYMRVQ